MLHTHQIFLPLIASTYFLSHKCQRGFSFLAGEWEQKQLTVTWSSGSWGGRGEGEGGCKERGEGSKEGIGSGGGEGWEKFKEVLEKRNEGDLETYLEPVRGGLQRRLALIAK